MTTIAYEAATGHGDFSKVHAIAPGSRKTRCGLHIGSYWEVGGDYQKTAHDRCIKCHKAVETELSDALSDVVSDAVTELHERTYKLTHAEKEVFYRELMRRFANSHTDTKWWNT